MKGIITRVPAHETSGQSGALAWIFCCNLFQAYSIDVQTLVIMQVGAG
jgi:hypothetical protein